MLKCPRCQTALTMTVNQGYCPHCGGMWFDGEYLNKIIESELKSQAHRESVGQPFNARNPQSDYHKAKNLFDELYSAYTKAVKE